MAVVRSFTDDEQKFIRLLAQILTEGEHVFNWEDVKAKVGCDDKAFTLLVQMMKECGALTRHVSNYGSHSQTWLLISPSVIHMVRQLDQGKQEDIVEKIQNTARSHPIGAWVIIGFLVLAALLSVVSNVVTLLEKFGVITTAVQK